MTTKTLMQIEALACDGWCDAEIARRTGCTHHTVRYHRTNAGIPPGENGRSGDKPKRYTAYDKRTSEYLYEGTIRELATALGLTLSSAKSIVNRTRRGMLNKYEFYEVTE